MSVMRINDVWLPDDRPLTVDDLQRLPDDGNIYELVDGVLEVTAAPFSIHERVVGRLFFLLQTACPTTCEVLPGSGVVFGNPSHFRIPDVVAIRAENFEPEYLTRPPLLVVEVASGSTALRDRNTKKKEYEQFGIASYWIVVPDPDRPRITAYELRDGRYSEVADVVGDEDFRTERPYPFAVTPRQLVTDGDWK